MPRSRCGLANRFIDVLLTLRYTNEKTHALQLKSIGYVVGKTASSKLNYFALINHTQLAQSSLSLHVWASKAEFSEGHKTRSGSCLNP